MHGRTMAILEKTNFMCSCTSLVPTLSALPELHLVAPQVSHSEALSSNCAVTQLYWYLPRPLS